MGRGVGGAVGVKLSADQREAIAQVSYDWQREHAQAAYKMHPGEADAIATLVDGWLGEAHAEHAPDESPGDVIAAYPDGTIILDDGITTWNPRRATEFLLGEARRDEQERIKAAVEAIAAADERTMEWMGDLDAAVFVAGFRADVLEVIEGSEAANRCSNCKGSGLVDQETGTPSHGMSSAAMECSECEGSGVIEGSEATP